MLIITDMPEIEESMPEHEYTKAEVLHLYAEQLRSLKALPADLQACAVLEHGQLITALRHTYRVCDLELLNAEVNS